MKGIRICDFGAQRLSHQLFKNPQKLGSISLHLIRENLYEGAVLAPAGRSVPSNITKTAPIGTRFIPANHLCQVIEPIDFLKVSEDCKMNPQRVALIQGIYSQDHGKVFLKKNDWCLATLIHETLHACSIMQFMDESMRNLYEGLTEFYTGTILSRTFATAYNMCWKADCRYHCQMQYREETQLWSAICNTIPIERTFPAYFYSGSDDWQTLFENFISTVRSLGFANFQNPLNTIITTTVDAMYDECSKNFSNFKKIYSSHFFVHRRK